MKKFQILFSFLALSTSVLAFHTYVNLGMATNFYRYNHEKRGFVEYSPNISAEIRQKLTFLELGGGIGYYHKVGGSQISILPVYGVAKWNLLPLVPLKPYIVGRVGRVLKTNEEVHGSTPSGRDFYGVGAGMEVFNNMQVEASYSFTKIRNDHRGSDWLNQISIGASYKLF